MTETHDADLVPTVPSRRQFLRLGVAGVAAATVLAACTDDESSPPSETGVTEPEPTETTFGPPQTTTPDDGAAEDARVTRTTRTVELAMVDVYASLLGGAGDLALPGEIDYDDDTRAALELLRARHVAHAEDLSALVAQTDGPAANEPNNGILEGVFEPQIDDLTTQRTVLLLARSLEDVAASTYGWGVGRVTTPELRAGLMAVGAVTARHGALLSVLLDPTGVDAARAPVLDISGPARLPDHMVINQFQDGSDALAEPAVIGEAAPAGEEPDDGEGSDTTEAEG